VHISELAQHHVENPREVVSQGDAVKVLILEVDAERRRLSLSLKRVEGNEHLAAATDLDLSEDVFSDETPAARAAVEEPEEAEDVEEPVEPAAEAETAEPAAEAEEPPGDEPSETE